jgi:hypothetical protein
VNIFYTEREGTTWWLQERRQYGGCEAEGGGDLYCEVEFGD